MRHRNSECGQSTVEFALLLPLFAVMCGCIIAVTAVCMQLLALGDTARNAARLAAVTLDPEATATGFVARVSPGSVVHVSTDGTTVTVTLRRTATLRLPFVGRATVPLPLSASATMVAEPVMAPDGAVPASH